MEREGEERPACEGIRPGEGCHVFPFLKGRRERERERERERRRKERGMVC